MANSVHSSFGNDENFAYNNTTANGLSKSGIDATELVDASNVPKETTTDSNTSSGICRYFPRPTIRTVLRYYAPLCGAASHAAFGAHVMNPRFLNSLFPYMDYAVANALLFNAHAGVGLFVYHRRHLSWFLGRGRWPRRVVYSVFVSVMFNFGSVLLWATVKNMLPVHYVTLRCLVAVASSVGLTYIGRQYLDLIDTAVRHGFAFSHRSSPKQLSSPKPPVE